MPGSPCAIGWRDVCAKPRRNDRLRARRPRHRSPSPRLGAAATLTWRCSAGVAVSSGCTSRRADALARAGGRGRRAGPPLGDPRVSFGWASRGRGRRPFCRRARRGAGRPAPSPLRRLTRRSDKAPSRPLDHELKLKSQAICRLSAWGGVDGSFVITGLRRRAGAPGELGRRHADGHSSPRFTCNMLRLSVPARYRRSRPLLS